MTPFDVFNFSENEWQSIEEIYEHAYNAAKAVSGTDGDLASNLLLLLKRGMTPEQLKALILGIMVGRMSR